MNKPEYSLDLSKLSTKDLERLIGTPGLPWNLFVNSAMLATLRENEDDSLYQTPEPETMSREWTIPTSPRTLQRVQSILKTG